MWFTYRHYTRGNTGDVMINDPIKVQSERASVRVTNVAPFSLSSVSRNRQPANPCGSRYPTRGNTGDVMINGPIKVQRSAGPREEQV